MHTIFLNFWCKLCCKLSTTFGLFWRNFLAENKHTNIRQVIMGMLSDIIIIHFNLHWK